MLSRLKRWAGGTDSIRDGFLTASFPFLINCSIVAIRLFPTSDPKPEDTELQPGWISKEPNHNKKTCSPTDKNHHYPEITRQGGEYSIKTPLLLGQGCPSEPPKGLVLRGRTGQWKESPLRSLMAIYHTIGRSGSLGERAGILRNVLMSGQSAFLVIKRC